MTSYLLPLVLVTSQVYSYTSANPVYSSFNDGISHMGPPPPPPPPPPTNSSYFSFTMDNKLHMPVHSSCNDTSLLAINHALSDVHTLSRVALTELLDPMTTSAALLDGPSQHPLLTSLYFGDAKRPNSMAAAVGFFATILLRDKQALLLRCDDPDGKCKANSDWAGHWRGEENPGETVICPSSFGLSASETDDGDSDDEDALAHLTPPQDKSKNKTSSIPGEINDIAVKAPDAPSVASNADPVGGPPSTNATAALDSPQLAPVPSITNNAPSPPPLPPSIPHKKRGVKAPIVEPRKFLDQVCSNGWTLSESRPELFWAADLIHRFLHLPLISGGQSIHVAKAYPNALHLARNEAERAAMNVANLQYFALDVYAQQKIKGGCTGPVGALVEEKHEEE